jgi:hypothetical protein
VLSSDNTIGDYGISLEIYPTDEKSFDLRSHVLKYNGFEYSTIADVPVKGSYVSNNQKYYAPIPLGWNVANYSEDAKFLAANFGFDTDVIVLSDGSSFFTANANADGGKVYDGSALLQEDSGYKCYTDVSVNYFCQILIVKNTPTSSDDVIGDDSINDYENAYKNLSIQFRTIAISMILIFLIISGLIYMYIIIF